tara:strand:- start:655 stop:903 length:249 start_codon:yes stop_codon:yes gene_type:complete
LASDPKVKTPIVIDILCDRSARKTNSTGVLGGQCVDEFGGGAFWVKSLQQDASITQSQEFVVAIVFDVETESARVLSRVRLK